MKRPVFFISLLLIIVLTSVGAYLAPQLPEQMASHWNSMNEVDGYLPKFWGIFLMPIISLGLLALFYVLPVIDPLRKNIEKFRIFYEGFILLMIIFLSYIHVLSLAWNLGYQFNMGQMILPSLGIVFFFSGILLQHAKRNWFIGIRTPWTLSDEKVWDKTHALGGKLFKVAGALAFMGFFFPDYAIWLILWPIIIFSVFLFVYSYVEYRKRHTV